MTENVMKRMISILISVLVLVASVTLTGCKKQNVPIQTEPAAGDHQTASPDSAEDTETVSETEPEPETVPLTNPEALSETEPEPIPESPHPDENSSGLEVSDDTEIIIDEEMGSGGF